MIDVIAAVLIGHIIMKTHSFLSAAHEKSDGVAEGLFLLMLRLSSILLIIVIIIAAFTNNIDLQ